jgi:hypothetical protein
MRSYFDGHLDSAWNALRWNRDYRKPLQTMYQVHDSCHRIARHLAIDDGFAALEIQKTNNASSD